MKIVNDKVIFETKRFDKFDFIAGSVKTILISLVTMITICFCLVSVSNDKMDDPKIVGMTSIQEEISDAYTKALDVDGKVSINIDEEIVVTVSSTNYELTSTYDIDGNLVDSKIDAKLSFGEAFVCIVAGLFAGLATFLILEIPCSIIGKKLKAKDADEKAIKYELENAYEDVRCARRHEDIMPEKVDEALGKYEALLEKYNIQGKKINF